MEIICNSLDETQKLASAFAALVAEKGCQKGYFISLFGEIGAGKTAFVKCVARALGVKKKVTSPSFVILNEYKGGGHIPIYHFDLYRLEKEGLSTISEELREYSRDGVLTFVEWADFGAGELPFERLNISVTYGEDDARVFKFEPVGEKNENIVRELKRRLNEHFNN